MNRYTAHGVHLVDGETNMHATFDGEEEAAYHAERLNNGTVARDVFDWRPNAFTGAPAPEPALRRTAPASTGFYPPLEGKKQGKFGPWFRKAWPYIAFLVGGIIVGSLAANAGGGKPDAVTVPQPVKTVTVEVPVEAPADTLCKEVALELFSMLQTTTEEVIIPLSQGGSDGINAFLNDDIAGLEAATALIQGASEAQDRLTARVDAVGPDYIACVQ